MGLEVVTKEDLQIFRLQLISDIKVLFHPRENLNKEILRSREVIKLLKISPGTLQTLRVNGILNPSKIGGIMFYKKKEIDDLLDSDKSFTNVKRH